jgi:hypothetical protein
MSETGERYPWVSLPDSVRLLAERQRRKSARQTAAGQDEHAQRTLMKAARNEKLAEQIDDLPSGS